MSKSLKKKSHWTSKVHESVIGRNPEGQLGFELKGGAENGQFPYLGEVKPGKVAYESGSKLVSEELLLEVNETPVAGLTIRDVLAVIKHCKDPLRLKCVKQGERSGLFRALPGSWTARSAGQWKGGLAVEGGVLHGGGVRSRVPAKQVRFVGDPNKGLNGREGGLRCGMQLCLRSYTLPFGRCLALCDLRGADELPRQNECASVASPAVDEELSGMDGRMDGRKEGKKGGKKKKEGEREGRT